jgi:hypothetical protein
MAGPGPHYSQCLAFDMPVLEFEAAVPEVNLITSPALDFSFAGAVEVGLVLGLVEKDVVGLRLSAMDLVLA